MARTEQDQISEEQERHSLEMHRQMQAWFRSPLGRHLLRAEKAAVERAVSRFFGYHQLEMLLGIDTEVGEKSLLGHRILAVPDLDHPDAAKALGRLQDNPSSGVLLCDADELPLASESIDLVILHHTLDVSQHPHQALREANRVLRSGGHMVLVGFNPVSSWGLRKLLSRSRRAPWNARFLTASRLEDWLSLLDFQVKKIGHSFFMPPVGNSSWLKRFAFLERLGIRLRLPMGAFYVMQAQKRVAGTMPLRSKWKTQPLTSGAVVHQFTPLSKK